MGLLHTFLGACAGDDGAGTALYTALTTLSTTALAGLRGSGASAPDAEDAVSTVIVRVWRSRARFLDELAEAGDQASLRGIRKASRRGVTQAEAVAAIGRPLSAAELAAFDSLADDLAVKKYLVAALRNVLRDRLRGLAKMTAEPEAVAVQPEPTIFDAVVPMLLTTVLAEYVAWGNAQSKGGGDRNRVALDELRAAQAAGVGAREVVRQAQPGLQGKAFTAAVGARRKMWSRARERFHKFVLDVRRSPRDERDCLPDVLRLFDDLYRIRQRAVRKEDPPRPPVQTGVSP